MKKSIIVILIIVSLYLLVVILGFNMLDNLTNKYIYIDNIGFKYSKGKWEKLNLSNNTLKKYEIYLPNTFEYIGKYNIRYNGKWYYEVDNIYTPYENILFAIKGKGMKIEKYDIKYELNDTKISDILSREGISYKELNLAKEMHIDLDNNGQIDVIYALSNVYSEESEDILFSVIIIKLNDEYQIVKKIINNDEVMLNLFAILDINNDSKLELIVNEEGFSLNGNTYEIYGLKDNKYQMMIKS